MHSRTVSIILLALLISPALPLSATEKSKTTANTEAVRPSYELPQPAKETIDYTMYQRIREEGLGHSHIMEYASGLMDGIGPRLTGSPNVKRANEWTREQLTAMGCANAHLEDWGEFGIGWQQLNTWVRMTSPDTAVFIAQASPWSPATNGPINAPAISMEVKKEEDLEKYKGKVAGKIVFLGEMREVKPVDKPLFVRDEDADLLRIHTYPTRFGNGFSFATFLKGQAFREKIGRFLAAENAIAAMTPSRDGRNGAAPAEPFSTTP